MSIGTQPPWMEKMAEEALEEARGQAAVRRRQRALEKYWNDPLGFCHEILGDKFTQDVQKVMLSVRDNPVTVARSANAIGKSFAAARAALWWFAVYPDSKVFMTAAPPLENLNRILWGQLLNIIKDRQDIFGGFKVRSLRIERHPESYIDGLTIPTSGTKQEREAKFSGKHAPQIFFIVDEGDAVPDEVYSGIESCMSGGLARLLIMFNPRTQAGPVYLRERDRQANVIELSAFRHPNVMTGNELIQGAVTRETTVRRINQWTRELVSGEHEDSSVFSLPDFLIGTTATSLDGVEYPPLPNIKRKIKDPAFSYMVLGKYPPMGETQLISTEWVEAARSRYDLYVATYGDRPPIGIRPTLGIDVAEMGADANVTCLRYGGYVAPMIWWNGIDPDLSTDKVVDIFVSKNGEVAMVDGTGVGSSVAPAMSRRGRDKGVRAVSVKLSGKPTNSAKTEIGEFKILRDQLWWSLREWLRTDPTSMLPPDKMLIEELRVPTYEVINGTIRVMNKETMRELLRRSPDRADALSLTFAPFQRPKILRLISRD